MSRGVFYILIFASLSFEAYGQFAYSVVDSIPVEVGGTKLSMAWTGGLNTAEISKIDLDGDGVEDLVVFDRMANKLFTFVNDHQAWRYAPKYESLFPAEIDQWLLLRDFNCDGRKDVFTHNIFGISVFVNITPAGGALRFRPYSKGNALYTQGFNSPVNLQVNGTDIPGIDDVDGDGDLDILDARFAGIGSIEWHKNMSIETTGKCDSMILVRITQTWGNFEECNCGEYLYNENDCSVFGGRAAHAAGKSILTLDTDGDGDRDLLFAEENCDQLYFLENLGTPDSAVMSGFGEYPAVNPVINFNIFPAAYFEDVDFDNVPDLVVGSNIYNRTLFSIDFEKSIWLYKNVGTAALPDFSFVKKNFLQDQMIDVGDNATPVLFDEDGDGDLDLFISSYNSTNISSHLFHFENVGSVTSPSFRFVTDDYAGISRLLLYNMKIHMNDLNADGKTDLAFTATASANAVTSLYYIPNSSTTRLSIEGTDPVNTGFEIETTENGLTIDVNQDGFIDVLVGNSIGALEYWRNAGPAGTFNLTLENDSYLGLNSTTNRQNLAPAAGDLDGDGKTDLVLGDQRGGLTFYDDFRSPNTVGVTNAIYDSVSAAYTSPNLGGRVWPTIGNIFYTGQPSIVVGNLLGGVHVLKSDLTGPLPKDAIIQVVPNPTASDKIFYITADRNVTAQMYSVFGNILSSPFSVSAYIRYPVDCSQLASGVYILKLTSNTQSFIYRMIIP